MKVLLIGPYARQKKVGQKVKVKREDFYPSAALLHLAAILRVNKYKPIIIDLICAGISSGPSKVCL